MQLIATLKYFIQYILLRALILIVRLIPLDVASKTLGTLATTIGPLLQVNKLARQNIYDHLTQDSAQIDKILHGMWNNLGHYVAEFIILPHLTINQLNKRIKVEGLKNITHIIDNKQPMLMMGGHFANWECAMRIIAKQFAPLSMVYRRANNPFINKYILNTRNVQNTILIEKGQAGVKSLIKSLKQKRNIAMLIDQRMNDGIPIPFLGTPAMTAPAIAKIAIKHNYPIVPMRVLRTSGSNFILRIYPPLEIAQNDTADNIMHKANHTLENWVKEKPEQWFWLHNRWGKSRNT